ncbi:MAG: methyl-accepting chemotaxis protein [Pseudomonadota bacterium]
MKSRWRISLKKKLFGFVGMASLLMLAVIGLGVFTYSNIETANFMKDDVHRIIKNALDIRVAEKTYLQFQTPELKENFDKKVNDIIVEIEAQKKEILNKEWQEKLLSIEGKIRAYRTLLEKLIEIQNEQNSLKANMLVPIATSEKLLTDILYDLQDKQGELHSKGETFSSEDIDMLTMITDCRIALLQLQGLQLQYLISGEEKIIQEYKKLSAETMDRYIGKLEHYASISNNSSFVETVATIKNALGKFVQSIAVSNQLYEKEKENTKLINEMGIGIIEEADSLLEKMGHYVVEQKSGTALYVLTLVCAGLMVFWVLSFMLVKSIIKPIGSVIRGLIESSHRVDSSSGQIAIAGENLAERASEQAAAIEETSSSLEQISSIIKQNADNTQQADMLVKEEKAIVGLANQSMEELKISMEGIARSGEEMSKIIKTIDGIAFQTNLLALNAAVEAARAGEAGAGFAVVAEEVRNLAMRAAEAAKNTAELIDKTIRSVQTGAQMTERNVNAFSQQIVISNKVGELIADIAGASMEQFEGIEQINKAVREMDTVIQQNAADAEQSSEASREMTVQARQLTVFVNELVKVLEGREELIGIAS